MKIRRIVPDISTADMQASGMFYGDFLGLRLASDMTWIRTYQSVSHETTQINVVAIDTMPSSDLSVEVPYPMLDELYAKASRARMKLIYPLTTEYYGVRRFIVRDPNGMAVTIMSFSPTTF